MQIKIYVANLGKYNEGELVGDWFTLPMDIETIKKRIGVADNTDYEEYAIHDYEAPFEIHEYESIEKLNGIAEKLAEMNETDAKVLAHLLDESWDLEDAIEKINNGEYAVYHDCYSMTDVAEHVVDECGYLNELPERLQGYFDYEAFGRDLEIEGNFAYLGEGVYVEIFN